RTHREEKLRAAAGLLANLLLKPGDPGKLSYTELDHFVRCLDALSIGAITVLGAASSIVRASASNLGGRERFAFERLRSKLPRQMEPELIMGLVGELSACYLLHLEEPLLYRLLSPRLEVPPNPQPEPTPEEPACAPG